MNEHDLEPLSAEARAMLDVERGRPDAGEDVSARVLAHLTTTVAIVGGPGGPGGSGTGGAPGSSGTGGAPGAALAGPFAAPRAIASLLAAFALGGGAGAVTHALLVKPPVPAAQVAPVVEAPLPPEHVDVRVASPPPAALSTMAPLVRPPRRDSASREVSGKDVNLALERALIERARMALAREQWSAASEALNEHARAFPSGRLSEEREALAVQALVHEGRAAEARSRAARFRSQYPSSVFLPAVEIAVDGAR